MSAKPILSVRGVCKKFCRHLKRSLMYGVVDLGRELVGLDGGARLRKKEFWALEDIDFSLQPGDSLGLIGLNGAGKTTLLKILHGLVKPTKGEVVVRGNMGALIALGAGFNPVLTGRENIFLNGAILGIPHREISRQFDEIVDFSELEDFLDTPVQSYSSGMKVRLGFSVAACLRPRILLLDEVLAVGDIAFARKSLTKVSALLNSGLTVIFVSHAIRQVEMICQKALMLHKGRMHAFGATEDVCRTYYAMANRKSLGPEAQAFAGLQGLHVQPDAFQVTGLEMLGKDGNPLTEFSILDAVRVRMTAEAFKTIDGLNIALQVQTVDGVYVTTLSSNGQGLPGRVSGRFRVECDLGQLPLREGAYHLILNVSDSGGPLFKSERTLDFIVTPDDYWYHQIGSRSGLVVVPATWRMN